MAGALFSSSLPGIEPHLALLAETAVARVCELSGRISASFVRSSWQRRAAWSGFARALQLQGVEIDAIDVFSWACEVNLPGRPRRVTVVDDFEAFGAWWDELNTLDRAGWKDTLPFTPDIKPELPRILQALEIQRQYALYSGSIAAWLSLPTLIYNLGLSQSPLPCLVAGSKSFRLMASVPPETVRATLKTMASSAERGLATLDAMEGSYRASAQAIRREYRPGKLPELLALSLSIAILNPARVASALDLSPAGAGKLLDRAASLEVLVEVSGRRSWKAYVLPDLAVSFGFRRAPLGRPRKAPPVSVQDRDLADTLDDFDRQMAEIDARLSRVTISR